MFRVYRRHGRTAPAPRAGRGAVDPAWAVVALVCSGIELLAQGLHGGAWGALPTIALLLGAVSVLALLRAARLVRAERRSHRTQDAP